LIDEGVGSCRLELAVNGMNGECFGVTGKAAGRAVMGWTLANWAGRLTRRFRDEWDGVNAGAAPRFALFKNRCKQCTVVEGGNSFADREEVVAAGKSCKQIDNIILFEPFFMAADM